MTEKMQERIVCHVFKTLGFENASHNENNIMNHYNKAASVPKPSLTVEQIDKTVSFLNRNFRETAEEYKARVGSNSNVRGSTLYDYQVEFAHIVDKIQRGPIFFAIQNIAEANELIGKLAGQQKV